jgi:geranylgeranyl pyrophosphate synthase
MKLLERVKSFFKKEEPPKFVAGMMIDLGEATVSLQMAYGQSLTVTFRGHATPFDRSVTTGAEKAAEYIFKSGQQGFFLIGSKYHNASEVRNITVEYKQYLGKDPR